MFEELLSSFDSPTNPSMLIQGGSVILLAVSGASENSESSNEASVGVELLLEGRLTANGKLMSEPENSTGESAHERRQLCCHLRHVVNAQCQQPGNRGWKLTWE